ncbi:MAG: winged helix-turn-helix domain-containing protein [Sedimenticola sp.]
MRLFLNPHVQCYVRELAQDFNVSPSQVKFELDNLNKSGLLNSEKSGRQILYRANQQHPLFPELQSMVRKSLGMDRIMDSIIQRLGALEQALIIDDYAEGKDTGIIDLVLIGHINQTNLIDLVGKTERYIGRKIRTLTLKPAEYFKLRDTFRKRPNLLIWSRSDAANEAPEKMVEG